MKNNIPKARKDGLVVQELDGEILIYDLETNRAFCLNQTSALIWQNCDGTKTVSEISAFLANELNNPANEDLIWLALDQLKKENLIENSSELETKFEGVSRRDVIRKIGLGSMVALPLIASLVAPHAIYAQTACGTVTTCRCQQNQATTAGAQCSTGGNGIPCSTGCRCIAGTTTSGTNPGPSGACRI